MSRMFLSLLLIALLGCSQRPVQETELFGYREGKRQMKYQETLLVANLDSGDKGYQHEVTVNYSLGTKDTYENVTTTWAGQEFQFVRSESRTERNGAVVTVRVERDGNRITQYRQEGDGEPEEVAVEFEGEVYSLHPQRYLQDLKQPGAEQAYQIYDESTQTVRTIRVKYIDNPNIFEDGVRYATRHYQIESVTTPGTFYDYWLDLKSGRQVKIQIGDVTFKPAA